MNPIAAAGAALFGLLAALAVLVWALLAIGAQAAVAALIAAGRVLRRPR